MIVDQIGCSGSSFVVAVGAFVAIARDAAVAVSMSLQLLSLSATVSVVDQRRLEQCCCNCAWIALANKEVSKNDWRLSAGWHSAAGIWNFLFINDKSSKTGKNKPFLRRNCANASVVEVDIYFHRWIIFVKWVRYRKT